MTPELWPVWCAARARSFSRITRRAPGRRARRARAVARPTMPPPTIAMSWIMAPRRLLERREGGRPPDVVAGPSGGGPVRCGRLPGRLPLRVRHERRPHPLAVGEVVVGADIDELVRFTDDGLPEADDPDPVLLEEVQRDLGEAPLEVGHAAGHHVVRAVLVDHRDPPGWPDSIVVADVIPSRREVRYAARRLRWRGSFSWSSRKDSRSAINRGGRSARPTTSSSHACRLTPSPSTATSTPRPRPCSASRSSTACRLSAPRRGA